MSYGVCGGLCCCLVAILCVIYNLGWNVSIINVKIYDSHAMNVTVGPVIRIILFT